MKIIREIEINPTKIEIYYKSDIINVHITETFTNPDGEETNNYCCHTIDIDKAAYTIITHLKEWIEKNLK